MSADDQQGVDPAQVSYTRILSFSVVFDIHDWQSEYWLSSIVFHSIGFHARTRRTGTWATSVRCETLHTDGTTCSRQIRESIVDWWCSCLRRESFRCLSASTKRFVRPSILRNEKNCDDDYVSTGKYFDRLTKVQKESKSLLSIETIDTYETWARGTKMVQRNPSRVKGVTLITDELNSVLTGEHSSLSLLTRILTISII